MSRADYDVTAVTYGDELIAIQSGDTSQACYGIAFDLGTTTVVGYLMDLTTRLGNGGCGCNEPQAVHGGDLISRISYATSHKDGGSKICRPRQWMP